MGACCSIEIQYGESREDDIEEHEHYYKVGEEQNHVRTGDNGAIVRVEGFSKTVSMFTQQGRKGINQDAMTVWEKFIGEKDTVFCGVFDGHGPSGHKIARHVRDNLPSKLSLAIKQSRLNGRLDGDIDVAAGDNFRHSDDQESRHNALLSSWKASLVKSFKQLDGELGLDCTIDSYCSGTTAVNIIRQDDLLIVANLGDSRAVLCTRGNKNELVPVQLTTDLKPDLASEAERIKNCRGRVFALDEEPDVYRVWMPDEDVPGLAMARAFGDFCLKDYGVISVPEVTYRKLTSDDEFVVLATDGVWDVLTNMEVVRTVACASKRSMAAKLVINRAVRAWRSKYPGSKIDDCAVVCLFLKNRPFIKSKSDISSGSSLNQVELAVSHSSRSSVRSHGIPDSLNGGSVDSREEYSALKGVSRVNSIVKLPRFTRGSSQGRKAKHYEDVQA
ncbi:hypothetical protein Pint_34976 [Pistacia integerrima]|uniref:Uncharacterized protein n=1 Tax=Pistacia integerrima TaxID=434235 RepID=A0ACC0Y488_9ROSI|nr:hypothetical protein Pint_34976 [Pistacia integerrima]